MTATLTSLGSPVMGQSVSFGTGSHVLCMATTNARGVARCKLTGWQTLLVEVNAFTITAELLRQHRLLSVLRDGALLLVPVSQQQPARERGLPGGPIEPATTMGQLATR